MNAPEPLPRVADIVAHRAPILMLETLTEWSAEGASARHVFKLGDYGLEDGIVIESALVELLAQLVAAMHGAEGRASGAGPKGGVLAKVSRFDWHSLVRVGEALDLRVEVEAKLGPMIQVTGTIVRDGELVASGTLQFVIGHPAS